MLEVAAYGMDGVESEVFPLARTIAGGWLIVAAYELDAREGESLEDVDEALAMMMPERVILLKEEISSGRWFDGRGREIKVRFREAELEQP